MEMHESERNRLWRKQQLLLHAASDMEQAIAAARALDTQREDVFLMRALETAIAVCYMRPFTNGWYGTLSPDYVPSDPGGSQLHRFLDERRHKAYAHIDKESGRSASITPLAGRGEWASFNREEQWLVFPREFIEPCVQLFYRQEKRFNADAVDIARQLDDADD